MGEASRQLTPSLAASALLLEVAHADGRLSPEERRYIDATLAEQFGIGGADAERVLRSADMARRSAEAWTFTNAVREWSSARQRALLSHIIHELAELDDEPSRARDHAVGRISNLLRVDTDAVRSAGSWKARGSRTTLLAVLSVLLVAAPASAQPKAEPVDVVTAAAGEHYQAGGLHRWLLGPHYRDLWSTPVRVPVLSMEETAGGLIPLRMGGGMQTRSLRLRGADGREYSFRLVDKDPSALLDSVFRGTVVADLVQDGISAAHPYGALVVAPLLDAAGVINATPLLRVMPHDPSLGPFQEEFAGRLGLFEERPDENGGGASAFAGARRVIGSERLTERLEEGPEDRVDARAYLRARLVDIVVGDWDRHRGQWRWASFDDGATRRWLPIPRDRDQAFSRFDGVATRVASVYVPQLVDFGGEYPSMTRLHWNARAIDRWFLAELEEADWREVGDSLVAALTDDVIDDAVRHLPAAVYAIDGARLSTELKRRRDGLTDAWRDFYGLLAREVDVFATDRDETIRVEGSEDGSLTVSIADASGAIPYFVRRFDAAETDEIRVYARDGRDQVFVAGAEPSEITIRIVGGPGDDRYVVAGGYHDLVLYDDEGEDVVVGDDAPSIDRRVFEEWEWSPETKNQPVDWGRRTLPVFWSSYTSDVGPFIGGGFRTERYGFRSAPYAWAMNLKGGFAPSMGRGRVELDAVVRRPNSSLYWTVAARASGTDVLHFHGFGNATASEGEAFHRVDLSRISGALGLGTSPEPWLDVSGSVELRQSSTRFDSGRFLASQGPIYGTGAHTSLSLGATVLVEPMKDDPTSPHRLRVELGGRVHPALLDSEDAFGRARGEISALIASSPRPAVSLALRAGVEKVFGRFPWHEAAFVGGQQTIRGWSEQRFAGDAAVHASSELRLRVSGPRRVLPADVGVFGFADAGRVRADRESPGGWHIGSGGGVYLHVAGQPSMIRLGFARSVESTKLFLGVGLPY